jgi:hypothetical protein
MVGHLLPTSGTWIKCKRGAKGGSVDLAGVTGRAWFGDVVGGTQDVGWGTREVF